MILYTPLALEDVLQGMDEMTAKRECVSYQGRMFYVDKMENGDYQLVQLISTDPNDYLNQQYLPGTNL